MFLKASRPRFWIYLLGPFAVGAAAATHGLTQTPHLAAILLGLFFTYPANLFIYGINDIFDFETDKQNEKKLGYEQVLEPKQHTKILTSIAIACVPWLALTPFIPLAASVSTGACLFLGLIYSAPPIRAKIHPGLDSLTNILYIMPGLAGFYAFGGIQPPILLVVAAMLWAMAMHAYSAVPDIEADTQAKLQTIATALGGYGTLVLCAILYITAGTLLSLTCPLIGAIGAGVYGSLMIISIITYKRGSILSIYKIFPYINTLIGAGLFFTALFQ
ncbi:MAG: hypothetical protein QG626_150 [Patescibacteria group bacterium]|jgi:4-hydroxybenzoate polyprenyltransferase|nr:hypothetical protein [Patescibacteria group bacterium]